MRITIDSVTEKLLKETVKDYEILNTKTGYKHNNSVNMALIPAGFDIESYKQYMYIWTFSICDLTVIGYTWTDFRYLLALLKKTFDLGKKSQTIHHRDGTKTIKNKASKVLPILIHNIKYEWAFMCHEVEVSEKPFFFDKAKKNPLNVLIYDSFMLIDSYKLFPMSLAKVAKAYCKTQKTHDLDYKKPRNVDDAKKLTEKELNYCCNDTRILVELADFVFDNYFRKYHKMPYTQNQMVKMVIKDSYKNEMAKLSKAEQTNYMKMLNRLTLSQKQYKLGRRDCFRGGSCCSSYSETDDKDSVEYHDLTSAYCGSICHDYYPMSAPSLPTMPFYAMHEKEIDYYTKKFCCQMQIKIYNLKSIGDKFFKYETYHNVVPYMPDGSEPRKDEKGHILREDSRIMSRSIEVDDANHIWKAACIVVSLTEIDWEIYKKVYTWDKLEVLDFMFETRGDLPDYVKKAALKLYGHKSALKKASKTSTPEYMSAKTLVSNVFGAMVQQVDKNLVNGSENEWLHHMLDQILKPLWGVYVAAHTRRKLVNMILTLGKDYWLYSDTDSIYNLKTTETTKLFKDYNNKIKLKNAILCEKYDLDFKLYDDLGCWDDESRKHLSIKHFKTLGPKQYLYFYTDDKHQHGDWKLVLAGISEEYFWEAYATKYPVCKITDKENEIKRIFDFFEKSTEIVYKRNIMTFVHDTKDIVNGVEVYCKDGAIIEEKTIKGTIGIVSEAVAMLALADEMDDTRV